MDGVLVLKRIRVAYALRAPDSDHEAAKRVHDVHARHCPVYRSLEGAIDIQTELQMEGHR